MNHPSEEVIFKRDELLDAACAAAGEYYVILAQRAIAEAVDWLESEHPAYGEYNLGALLKTAAAQICHDACLQDREAAQLLEHAVELVTSHLNPKGLLPSVKYADLTHVTSSKVSRLILRGALFD